MSGPRFYPDEPAERFPRPPRTVSDDEDRTVGLMTVDLTETVAPLVAMYERFDPDDRAQGVPPVGADRVRRWLEELAAGYNLVARVDDRVVGHATLVPDGDDGYELAIFVERPYQGAGIGTALLETLLGHGQAQGVERVWLTVERWNRPAVHIYERAGFETTDAASFELEMSIRL